MGCTKRTKNGDIISWPCGKKPDGHQFGSGVLSGRAGYKENKKKRKARKKDPNYTGLL